MKKPVKAPAMATDHQGNIMPNVYAKIGQIISETINFII
jgi:hypothetical protein